MKKHCKHCLNPFIAPPSGAKYCKYECYVYDQIKGVNRQQDMIDHYRAIQSQMDIFNAETKRHIERGKKQ